MTQDSKFKKDVRARMRATGEKYTEARRALVAASSASPSADGVEPHYKFTPPGTIEYVDGNGRRFLPVPKEAGPGFMWGYAGTGPNTAAWALLVDATGSADPDLAMAFTDDNLNWPDEIADQAFVMTIAEVKAWRAETEPAVRAMEREEKWFSDMIDRVRADYQEAAKHGPRKPWWQQHRDAHGEPSI